VELSRRHEPEQQRGDSLERRCSAELAGVVVVVVVVREMVCLGSG
jgi:hypothetical protein